MLTMFRTLIRRGSNLVRHGAYLPTEYLVFDDKCLVYIPIPKVACTSIKTALVHGGNCSGPSPGSPHGIHREANRYGTYSLGRHRERFFKFAFVRNPFERLVSCFANKVQTPIQHNSRHFFATRYNNVLIRTLFGGRFHEDMSFEDFAALVAKIPDRFSDGHFKSQYSFLFSRSGHRIPDFIGKFENIAEDWDSLALKYGFPPLRTMNQINRKTWQDFYTSIELVEMVAARYRNDIECFDYRDEYNELRSRVENGTKSTA